MACCCCQGPGVCCQGTNCSSGISACECQQQGGNFKQGRECGQADLCCCPGQICTQVDLCAPCGCPRGPSPCGCKLKSSVNVTLNFLYGGAEVYRPYFEPAMQAGSGTFALNLLVLSDLTSPCNFTYQFWQNKDGLEDADAPQVVVSLDAGGLVVSVGQARESWFWVTDLRSPGVPSQFFCEGQTGAFSGQVPLVGEVPGPNIPVGTATYSF